MTSTNQDHRPIHRNTRTPRLAVAFCLMAVVLLAATTVLVVTRQSSSDGDARRTQPSADAMQIDAAARN